MEILKLTTARLIISLFIIFILISIIGCDSGWSIMDWDVK